ncbi:hypothetical protein Vadar_002941 [Vaccinium darrowii]|uniref:Uncharacterized protein n=1 Tax=Vaccinium darrowii TaxID=229202 RepID=A0ACB7WX84_9ERIC|nr:hypothetical protein Vadar_002941 [Vaccinium darrowii]
MSREGMFTLFVDNLPELVSLSWLKNMFNNYGVVKDAFIPEKRSKISERKFGFARYNCSISAEVAIARANGLWCEDKKLFVKYASFNQYQHRKSTNAKVGLYKHAGVGAFYHNEQDREITSHGENNLKGTEGHHVSTFNSVTGFKSYAQTLSGKLDVHGVLYKVRIQEIHNPDGFKVDTRISQEENLLVVDKSVEEPIDSFQSWVPDTNEAQPDSTGSLGCSDSWVGDSLGLVPLRETLGIGSDASLSKALDLVSEGADLTKDTPASEEAKNSVEDVAKSMEEVVDSLENVEDPV